MKVRGRFDIEKKYDKNTDIKGMQAQEEGTTQEKSMTQEESTTKIWMFEK